MKPYGYVWRGISLLCIFVLAGLIVQLPLVKPVNATQGTWVIENQTVSIENNDFTHEGDIIIRGTGKLTIQNSSFTIVQILSWQFQIRVEDSGMFIIDNSDIRSKYPFQIECHSNSVINTTSSSLSNALIILNDYSLCEGHDTSFLGVSANEKAQTTFYSCNLRTAVSNDGSSMIVNNSDLESISINDNSQSNISTSHIGPIVVESSKTAALTDCSADALRGWGESKLIVSGCTLGDYRYSDNVEASISNSSIGDLDATGTSPLFLNQIVIGSATLRGFANVTMNECTVGSIEVYLNSTINLWNSTCGDFLSTEYADVKILGSSSAKSFLGNCIITQLCTAIITWSIFDYLEIAHSATAQVNDSYAVYFRTWRYTTCIVDIWRCDFYELRVSGSQVSMYDTSVEIWSNIDTSTHFTAKSCYFGADLTFYSNTPAYLENCTMNRLRPQYQSQVVIRNCTVLVALLDYANRIRTVDSVPVGDISYWTSEPSFPEVQWNLTVHDSRLTGWDIYFRFEQDYTVVNSTLNRVGVSAALCSVDIRNSSIDQLVVTNGQTEAYQTYIRWIEVQQSAHLVLNESTCFEIRNSHDATSTHYNSTFDRFYSYAQSNCQLFDCVIRSVGPSGNTHIFLDNCTMTYFDAFQYAISELVNSTVETRLAALDYTYTSITNSSIALLNGYDWSQFEISSCVFTDIRLLESSEVIMSDSTVVYIRCIGTTSLLISGNLTGTTSCVIENSAQVIRELNFVIEDQLGNPLQSATVEIYDPLGSPVISGVTDSQGLCTLSLVFDLGWFGFLSSFSVMAIYGGEDTTIAFMTTTTQPITLIVDLSGTYLALTDTIEQDWSQDDGTEDILEGNENQALIEPDIIGFVIYSLCLVSLSLLITYEDGRRFIQESSLTKRCLTILTRIQNWLATRFPKFYSKQEDVKI